uniref:Uncharacterized protein n=1 Tax=Amphimedon queenslandica TaxID=400682 RepID=A0A1X7TBK1_AMPQE
MCKYINFHFNSIQLNIILPLAPGPEATPTTTNNNIPEGISINEEGNKRRIQVRVSNSITLAQLKKELVPLIGVPPTSFRLYRIRDNKEYELKRLDMILMNIESGSELIVRLGRTLRRGEERIELYLLQVNDTEFCKFMMESIVTEGTPVGEFKKQIIEEAKVQGIDCVPELDKSRDNRYNPKHVIGKLSELSGVPAKYIYFSEGISFPVEISCLDIENKLDWYSIKSGRYPLRLYDDDGRVLYYKDNRETMKELTYKERSEIQEAEKARLEKIKECKSEHEHFI